MYDSSKHRNTPFDGHSENPIKNHRSPANILLEERITASCSSSLGVCKPELGRQNPGKSKQSTSRRGQLPALANNARWIYAQPACCCPMLRGTLNLGPWRKATGYRRNDSSSSIAGDHARSTRATPCADSHLSTPSPASFGIATHTHTYTMLSSARTGASLALRGELRMNEGRASIAASSFELPSTHPHGYAMPRTPIAAAALSIWKLTTPLQSHTARPTTSLAPFRAGAAISSSARKDAGAVQTHTPYGLAKRERKEVPLPSQEGTKGLVQYALYVPPDETPPPPTTRVCRAQANHPPPAAPAQPSTS